MVIIQLTDVTDVLKQKIHSIQGRDILGELDRQSSIILYCQRSIIVTFSLIEDQIGSLVVGKPYTVTEMTFAWTRSQVNSAVANIKQRKNRICG